MVSVNPKLRWRWESKDKVLLNNLLVMNRAGGEILEYCGSSKNISNIVKAMKNRYPSVPEEKLRSGIAELMDKLLEWRILLRDDRYSLQDSSMLVAPKYMERIASSFQNELIAPVEVEIGITDACNARCLHCSVPSATCRNEQELTTAEWIKVIDELIDLEVFSLLFTGGEPLLRQDLQSLVKHAADGGLMVGVVTNAYLLTRERIDRLYSAGVSGVAVSLDGSNAQTHDEFRGVPGIFEKAIEAITNLVDRRIDVAILTVINKMNFVQIPQIMELGSQLGARQHSLVRLREIGRAATNKFLHLSPSEHISALRSIYDTHSRLKTVSVIFPHLPAMYYEKSIGLDYYRKLKETGKLEVCGAGIISCSIGPTGNVRPCDTSGEISLGNVRRQSLKEIWNRAPFFKRLRKLNRNEITPCKECRLLNMCTAGCRALPFQLNEINSFFVADPACSECFNYVQEKLK